MEQFELLRRRLFLAKVERIFGGGTAYTAITHKEAREMLGWKRIPTVVIGGFAVLLALLSLIVRLLQP